MPPECVMQLYISGKQNKRLFRSAVHSFDQNETDDKKRSVWNYNVFASSLSLQLLPAADTLFALQFSSVKT